MPERKVYEMPQNLNNTRVKDSSSKLIFGDPILCAQFLRGYLDIPMLKDVQPEDIEDVTERFVHMFTEERNSDVIKKVHLKKGEMPFCFISLIEHKSEVDYNVVMQIFRYMAFIWEDSVRSTSSHSQQRLFRGEVLSLTPENAQIRHSHARESVGRRVLNTRRFCRSCSTTVRKTGRQTCVFTTGLPVVIC